MTSMWKIIWPVLLIAVLAPLTAHFVETPVYPASRVHVPLVLVLALGTVFFTVFSSLRHSYGSLAVASALAFLTVVSALLPDLWLRWPAQSLLGIGLSQAGIAIMYPLIRKSPKSRTITVWALGILSAVPVASTIYYQAGDFLADLAGAIGALLLFVGGVVAWVKRQRGTVAGFFSWILVALTGIALAGLHFIVNDGPLALRQQLEHGLLYALLVMAAIFIAEMFRVEQQLRSGPHMELEASFRDPLTGLANRRALETYGPRLITQSHEAGRAVSVIITDIDHFKRVNDTHGHLAGDAVLKSTAAKLSASVRKSDLVARYGGEEFVIILSGSPLAPALRLAERMRAILESDTVTYEELTLTRTASFGVATAFPEEPASLTELIHRADTNLYRAKHKGRNCVMADALPANDF